MAEADDAMNPAPAGTGDDRAAERAHGSPLRPPGNRLEDRVVAMQATLHGIAKHHGLILDDHEARIANLERHS